jgi:hypothetical protein
MTQDSSIIGQAWREIVTRPTLEDFAAAFSNEVVLETSTGTRALRGPIALRHFFEATRGMYDSIAFVRETRAGRSAVLEWEGVFQGAPIAGATILCYGVDGRIEGIQLYHRPYAQVVAFAAALSARLAGKIESGVFVA